MVAPRAIVHVGPAWGCLADATWVTSTARLTAPPVVADVRDAAPPQEMLVLLGIRATPEEAVLDASPTLARALAGTALVPRRPAVGAALAPPADEAACEASPLVLAVVGVSAAAM